MRICRQYRSTNIVLCAAVDHLLAGVWKAGVLQLSQQFSNDESGQAALSAFLQQYPSTPIYLMVNAQEEDYRLESLPHTSGAARNELLARKLNQFYRGLQYRSAHFSWRDTDKRQDDHFLFAAITNETFIEGWIAVLQQRQVRLAGIYLLPVLSQWLIDEIELTAPHILLCERLSSGLRQTYFHKGRISLSRLVPDLPEDATSAAYCYLEETEKMRLYLMSKRFISIDTQLQLVAAESPASPQPITQALREGLGMECVDINTAAIAKKLGLPNAEYRARPELLYMQLLAKGHRADNLAPDTLTRQFRLSRIKRMLNLGAASVALLGTVLSAWVFAEGLEYHKAYTQTLQETAKQEHHYRQVAKHFPAASVGAGSLRQAVTLHNTILTFPTSPRRLMQVLSAALDQSRPEAMENIRLQRLHWMLSNDRDVNDNDSPGSSATEPAEDMRTEKRSRTPENSTVLYEIGFVSAEITAFDGDYRAAQNTVKQYVDNIKADGRTAYVEVIEAPVDVSALAALQGSTANDPKSEKRTAFFKLKVILKPAGQVQTAAAGGEQS